MPDTELAPEEFGRKGLTVSYAGHYLFVDNVPRPMHKHRGAELVLFTRGRCATKTETGATFECTPETLLVIPPGMKHIQYDNSADCETYYAVFEDADGTADLSLRLLDLHGEPMLQRWLTDLFELCSRHEFGPASALLTAAWGHLESFEAARGRGLLHPVLAKALPVMLDRFDEDFSMTDLAQECSVSVSLLNQLFRKRFGIGPRQFLIAVRMREARLLLLNPDYNISEVARLTGFRTINYFIRQFKAFHNVTPCRYRQDPDRYSDQVKTTVELFDF